MSTTTNAEWIFSRAIHLMDEQNETTGATRTQDTEEYRLRTLSILNVLRNEVYLYSDLRTSGVCPEIGTFEQIIEIEDELAQGVLPYGLAAHLLLGENDVLASFFNQKYQENLYSIGTRKTAKWVQIDVPYGGI